jgi:hypothetical protein
MAWQDDPQAVNALKAAWRRLMFAVGSSTVILGGFMGWLYWTYGR